MMETLTWDSEELTGPIVCEDLGPFRNFATRGRNRVMPNAPGTREVPPVRDELDVTLVWSVTGRFDPDGTPHSSQDLGVELNLEHYRALFTTGTSHSISLAFAGTTFDGDAQLRDYAQVRTGPGTARIITRLTITAGQLDEAGS